MSPPERPTRQRDLRAVIGLWAGLAGFAVLALAPLGGAETTLARRMAGVAWLIACWWVSEALPLGATALLPVVLLPLLGVMPARDVCANFGSPLILLFLAGFLLATALSRWRLDQRLAFRVILLMGERPTRIVLGMMGVTAFLSMWVSNSATAAMMMPVGLSLVAHARSLVARENSADVHLNATPQTPFRFGTAVMLGIAYAASIGGVGTLIGSPPNVMLAGVLREQQGIEISFTRWMMIGLPTALVLLPLAWLWLVRFAYPPEIRRLPGGRRVVREQLSALPPLGPGARRTALVVCATALAWVTQPIWKVWLASGPLLNDAVVGVAGAIAMFAIPSGERRGEALLGGEAFRKIPWQVLLLFGGGLALADGFAASGLSELIGSAAVALGDVPTLVFVALAVSIVILLTEFASNTAITAMVLPLLAAAASSLGTPSMMLMTPAALAASMAFMMPAATPPNAIVFGTGYVTIPQMVRAGAMMNLIAVVVIVVMTYAIIGQVF